MRGPSLQFSPVRFSAEIGVLSRAFCLYPCAVNSPIPPHLQQAYADCQRRAFGHYENFPVASLLLPRQPRPHIAALYTFARTADDFADEDKYEGRRLKELDVWEKGLKTAMKGLKASPPLQAFAHTLKTFQIPLSLPLDLLRAFRMDLAHHRYSTWSSVLYYCRHSANPVGRMVLLISGIRDKKLHEYSDFICSGLQLINFWQDTAIDLKRGRIYYPLPSRIPPLSGIWRKGPWISPRLISRKAIPCWNRSPGACGWS
jgi:hydroxysqualene synthase